MTAPVAGLPMYDWPEVRGAWDALWTAIAGALRAAGHPAPDALDRDLPLEDLWTHPALALAQTCGLPFVRGLRGRTALVGTPDFAVPGCPPGWYRSALVVRAADDRGDLRAFRGARLAVNGAGSQSGAQAMMHELHAAGVSGRFFAEVLLTGAHEAGAAAVAGGRADIAAIDWISWRLVRAHRAYAEDLRVLARTAPAPGLPLIAAGTGAAEPSRTEAVAAGIAAAPAAAAALGLAGLVRTRPEDYDLLAARDASGRALSAAHGL